MARDRSMTITAFVLVLLFVGGIAGTYYFWPSNGDQRSAAFFSVLQFIAVFALVWLTFLYVTATQQLVETTQQQLSDQNRPPKISVIQYHFPQADPFSVKFEIEIAKPSIRATSLRIKEHSNRGSFRTRRLFRGRSEQEGKDHCPGSGLGECHRQS
jgi:hypothetical protein